MSDHKITLPPLPSVAWRALYLPDVFKDFARAAVLLDRQQRAAPSAEPVPDDEYMIDMFSAAELRAYDYGCKESMDAFIRLLDGKGSRDGVCQPQWQALRARVWKLMDASPPDHLAVMRQALEALEERYIGALRDNAIDALRAALERKR
jgi:hypothetical protein